MSLVNRKCKRKRQDNQFSYTPANENTILSGGMKKSPTVVQDLDLKGMCLKMNGKIFVVNNNTNRNSYPLLFNDDAPSF